MQFSKQVEYEKYPPIREDFKNKISPIVLNDKEKVELQSVILQDTLKSVGLQCVPDFPDNTVESDSESDCEQKDARNVVPKSQKFTIT